MKKIITEILQADDRAHHHTAMVVAGVFLFGFMAFWQLLMPHMETHASYSPTWCTDNSGSIDIPLSECNALTDLYVSTNGDNWNDNGGWFSGTDICNTWTGVSCYTNTIYSLNLSNNNLSGVLPSSIGNLVSLDFLGLNHNHLYGEIPQELWSIPTLRNVSLYSNNFSGLLSPDFSQIISPRGFFLSANPDLIIDFDAFSTINPSIEFLNIDQTLFTGNLSNVGLLTGLTYLSINSGFLGNDASTIRGGVTNLSNLLTLKLKNLYLHGELPDVWESFPNLQELSLEFNNFSGPLPPSFASLTGLHNLVLSFNNFEGPIPSYFADMSITGSNNSNITTNCFETDVNNPMLENALDTNFGGWRTQFNCRANVAVTGNILGTGLVAGSCSTYQISYENIGPQTAKNLKIGQIFDPQITVSGSIPSYTTGLVGSVYGADEDPCYADAAVNATGPYYAALESIVQTNYGAPSLYAIAVNGLGFTGAQHTTEFAYVMDNACPFLFGTTDRALCFILFGQDMSEVDPSCGVGGDDGYLWNLGDVVYGATGTIDVNLCLPNNATGTVSFTSMVTTVSTNENSDGGSQFFNFTVTNNQGNTGNNQDTGDTDTGSTPPPIVQHNHGGERSTVTKDKCLPNPPGDQSSSYYDGDCGSQQKHDAANDTSGSTASGTENTDVDVKHFLPDGSVIQNYIASLADRLSANTEEISAFLFAKAAVLTGITNFSDLRPYDGITRGEFAKLLVAFVENVLGRKADATRLQMCSRYTDVDSSLGDLQNYIYKACIYSMMGLQNDGTTPLDAFDPYAVLTRKDVVTTIDRMINSTTNDNAVPYYAKHMRALYNAKLITDTDPDKVELRINAFIMFERITEQFDTLFQ